MYFLFVNNFTCRGKYFKLSLVLISGEQYISVRKSAIYTRVDGNIPDNQSRILKSISKQVNKPMRNDCLIYGVTNT